MKNSSDVKYALNKFEELWKDGVDISKEYIDTVHTKTSIDVITPYELYLKFLYEYFKEKSVLIKKNFLKIHTINYMELNIENWLAKI